MKSFIQFLVFTTTVLFFVACGSKENKKGKEDLASWKNNSKKYKPKLRHLKMQIPAEKTLVSSQ